MDDVSRHEVVTIQLGEQANFLGSHFWNTQDHYLTQAESSIDHNVHWKETRDVNRQETCKPRVLIIDFKSKFGKLRKYNELYHDSSQDPSSSNPWGSNVVTQTEASIPQHRYIQQLNNQVANPPPLQEGEIRYWSDYAHVFYHPSSTVQMPESFTEPDGRAFDTWDSGQDLFRNLTRQNDPWDEYLRPLVEQCNQMQGLQIVSSVNDGWGGFTNLFLESAMEEMTKTQTWLWALSMTAQNNTRSKVNQAQAVTHMRDMTSLYIPMTDCPLYSPEEDPPAHGGNQGMRRTLHVGRDSWSRSAVQASLMETVTLPTRTRGVSGDVQASMSDIAQQFTQPRNVIEPRLQINRRRDVGVNYFPYDSTGDDTCEALPEEPALWADVEVSRGGYELPTNGSHMPVRPTSAEEKKQHNISEHLKRYHSDLEFPLLPSFPTAIYPTEPRDRAGLAFAAALQTTALPGRWSRYLLKRSQRHMGEDGEDVKEGLNRMWDEYTDNKGVEDSDSFFDDDY
ncbi:MAG: mtDNA inheritance, partitioning of the mitochondrial organelle [Chrysothrix sp. TS-e1954]|nr:MAG: mtDNA inheritance, partitioning of the mitochondrial organelle [Chrysothrix sp. TS-e1954]